MQTQPPYSVNCYCYVNYICMEKFVMVTISNVIVMLFVTNGILKTKYHKLFTDVCEIV